MKKEVVNHIGRTGDNRQYSGFWKFLNFTKFHGEFFKVNF